MAAVNATDFELPHKPMDDVCIILYTVSGRYGLTLLLR